MARIILFSDWLYKNILNIRNILSCSLLFRIIVGTNLAEAFHVFFMALTVINSDFFLLSYLHWYPGKDRPHCRCCVHCAIISTYRHIPIQHFPTRSQTRLWKRTSTFWMFCSIWTLVLSLLQGLLYLHYHKGMAIYAVDNEEEMSPAERKQKRTNLKEIIKQDFIDVWTVDNGHANHFLCDDFRTWKSTS